jgi:flavin reductase (DIM6/NTAB) family NADH-FMN oxidoreductase RutF
MGAFATGVTVITAPREDGGGCIGMTVNSYCSVSLQPPMVLWCLRTNARHFRHFQSASHFNVNVLATDQLWLSQRFAGRVTDRFADIPHRLSASGVPLLAGCVALLECRTRAVHPCGDHAIVLGEVEGLGTSDRAGLIFHRGRFVTGVRAECDGIMPIHGGVAPDVIDFW